MIQLAYNDPTLGASTYTVPDTLKYDVIEPELNYTAERAPYSYTIVVTGDGGYKPTPIKLTGNLYFTTDADAESWISTAITITDNITGATLDSNTYTVLAADFVAIPTNLPRIMKVTITLYPETY